MSTAIPRGAPPPRDLGETRALREARRRLRRRSWLMAFAVFFTLAPFSFVSTTSGTWWMLRDAPKSAAIYAAIGVVFWVLFAVERRRSKGL